MQRVTPRSSWSIAGAAASLAMLVLLAACGRSPSLALAPDSATAALVRGGTVTVAVTLTRSGGAASDVALSVAGLPAHVTAAFDPPTLSGTATASMLRLSAAAAAAEGASELTLSATSGSLAASGGLSLDVTSLTVTGMVEGAMGEPVAGVVAASQGQVAASGSDGSFELSGLAVPYDLTLTGGAGAWAHVYQELTAEAPRLRPAGLVMGGPVSASSATLGGALTGAAVPVPADHVVRVCVEGLNGAAYGCTSVTAGAASYSLPVSWIAAAPLSLRVHALAVGLDPVTNRPVGYAGYGTVLTTLADGATVTADLTLGAAPASVTFDATVTTAGTLNALLGAVRFSPNLNMMLFQDLSGEATVSVPMPAIDGVTYQAFAGTTAPGTEIALTWGSSGASAEVTLVTPPVAQLVAPADMATEVTGATSFTVASPASGAFTYLWVPNAAGPTVALTTLRTTVTLPDLAGSGVSLPAGSVYGWQVVQVDQDDVALAAPHGIADYIDLILMSSLGGPGTAGAGSFFLSPERTFTLAP